MAKGILNRHRDCHPAKGWRRYGWRDVPNLPGRRDALAYVQALFARFMVARSGAAAAEYTFLVALISIVAAIGMILFGDDLNDYFQGLATALDNASAPTSDPFAT